MTRKTSKKWESLYNQFTFRARLTQSICRQMKTRGRNFWHLVKTRSASWTLSEHTNSTCFKETRILSKLETVQVHPKVMKSLQVSHSQAWPESNLFLFSTEKVRRWFTTVKARNWWWNQEYSSLRRKKCFKTAKPWLLRASELLSLLKRSSNRLKSMNLWLQSMKLCSVNSWKSETRKSRLLRIWSKKIWTS